MTFVTEAVAPGAAGASPALLAAPRADLRISQGQSEYLDVIRGLAAQLVLVQHLLSYSFPGRRLDEYGLGALGVLAFFLLSGFLITDSIAARLAAGRFSLGEFVVSRFSRIYTPFLPAILLVAALDWVSSSRPSYEYLASFNLRTALGNVLMLQDFPLFQVLRRLGMPEQDWFLKSFGSGRQFWTVSIEWWIYITVGTATAVALGSRSRVLMAVLAFSAVETLYNLVGGPGDSLTAFWLIGAAAALTYRRFGRAVPRRAGLALLALLVVLAGTRLFFTHGRVYEPVFALLLGAVLFGPMLWAPAASEVGAVSLLRRLRLDRLSFNSYSLYLTHASVVVWLSVMHPALLAGTRGFLFAVVLSNLVGLVFAALFELPHRRVRTWLLAWLGSAGPMPRSGSAAR